MGQCPHTIIQGEVPFVLPPRRGADCAGIVPSGAQAAAVDFQSAIAAAVLSFRLFGSGPTPGATLDFTSQHSAGTSLQRRETCRYTGECRTGRQHSCAAAAL